MRLLNTRTYILEEFFEGSIPPYAILSHRWETEEVIFQDIGHPQARFKKGWAKIEGCCQQALKDGFEWAWIDSCCIDKRSSAELSEAINSMFSWYQKAETCYAFLSDVRELQWSQSPQRKLQVTNEEQIREEILHSLWFSRGWTLQELLAPRSLLFFNRKWEVLGDKMALADVVRSASGIESLQDWDKASVAQKFSWAAKRVTTKVEDRAYSLMGLFGINMSPIYGEGEKAFLRLQRQIIEESNDETIFAWRGDGKEASGLLAHSPDAFLYSGNIRSFDFRHDRPAFAMTNKGLRFQSCLLKAPVPGSHFDDEEVLFALQCSERGKDGKAARLAVRLKYLEGDVYARVDTDKLELLDQEKEDYINNEEKAGNAKGFHVRQYPAMDLQGPYTFMTNTRREDRHEFGGLVLVDWYVTKPVRGRWSWWGGEAILQTRVLPVARMNAAIMFENGQMLHRKDKFVFVMEIHKHKIKHTVFSLPPDHEKNLEHVMKMWEDDSNAFGFDRLANPWPSETRLNSGTSVTVGLRPIDTESFGYQIQIIIKPEQAVVDAAARMILASETLSIVIHLGNQYLD